MKIEDLKLGMKVRIKKGLKESDFTCKGTGRNFGLLEEMKEYEGKEVTISRVGAYTDKRVQIIRVHENSWAWTPQVFEPLNVRDYEVIDCNSMKELIENKKLHNILDIAFEILGQSFDIDKVIFNDRATIVFYRVYGKTKKVTTVFDGDGEYSQMKAIEVCINKIAYRTARDRMREFLR